MRHLSYHRARWCMLVGTIVAILFLGCSPSSRRGAGPEPRATVEQKEIAAQLERIDLSLEFRPGTKSRYRVITEVITTVENREISTRDDSSATPIARSSEASEVVFTRQILEPVPEEPNTVVALITIEQLKYSRKSPEQTDLVFDSLEPADRNSPFARLIGQTYTIEIHPLGYILGAFNLSPARLAVKGTGPAHAAALDLVSPTAIFQRHGFFSLPGPDVGSLATGGRWRGVQQVTFRKPGTYGDRLLTHRFEKIYRLESVEQRPVGTVAIVTFAGSARPRRSKDGRLSETPSLSCLYEGGGEFNLDSGRVEEYMEQLEVRMPLPSTGSSPAGGAKGGIVTATRSLRVERLGLE